MTQALLDLGPRVGPAPSGSRGGSGGSRQGDGAATSFDETFGAAVGQATGTSSVAASGPVANRGDQTEAPHTDAADGTSPGAADRASDSSAPVGDTRGRDAEPGRDRQGHQGRGGDAHEPEPQGLGWSVPPHTAHAPQNLAHGVHAARRAVRGDGSAPGAVDAAESADPSRPGKHRDLGAGPAGKAADIRSAATAFAVSVTSATPGRPNPHSRGINTATAAGGSAPIDPAGASSRHSATDALAGVAAQRDSHTARHAAARDAAARATVGATSHADSPGPAPHALPTMPEPAPPAAKQTAAAPATGVGQHRARESATTATDAAARTTSPTAVHLPGTATLTHTAPVSAPTQPAPAPMAQPELAGTLARLRMAADGTYQLHVSVHPAELGGVNVTATVQHGVLSVVLAPDQSAHHAISQALPQLRAHLADQGFVGVDVGLGSPQQGGGQPGEQGPHAHGSSHSTPPRSGTSVDSVGESADHGTHSVRYRSDHATLDRLL